jgi:hypothetical protein
MRYTSVPIAVLAATISWMTAQAEPLYPVTPEEIGIRPPPARYTSITFRCANGPAENFYHGAWYAGQPTALYRGKARAVLSVCRLSRGAADMSLRSQ